MHLLCFAAAFPIRPCRVYNSLEQDVYDIPSRSETRQRRVCLTNPLVNHDKAMIPTCVLKVQVKLPPQIVLDADLLAPPEMDSGILALTGLDSGFLAPLGSSLALLRVPGLRCSPGSFRARRPVHKEDGSSELFPKAPELSWELMVSPWSSCALLGAPRLS